MEQLMEKLDVKEFGRAIDVGCGDGGYTVDHLIKKFTAVDMFDKNDAVIKKVKDLKKKHSQIKNVETATMQDYEFKEKYNGIFLRWSIGYLHKE